MLQHSTKLREKSRDTGGTYTQSNRTAPDPSLMEDPFHIRVNPAGNMILPFETDTAYLYYPASEILRQMRVPEGDRFFLPNSSVRF